MWTSLCSCNIVHPGNLFSFHTHNDQPGEEEKVICFFLLSNQGHPSCSADQVDWAHRNHQYHRAGPADGAGQADGVHWSHQVRWASFTRDYLSLLVACRKKKLNRVQQQDVWRSHPCVSICECYVLCCLRCDKHSTNPSTVKHTRQGR